MFQFHLGVCTNALVKHDAELGRLAAERDYASFIRTLITALRSKAPAGIVRDLMLFSYVAQRLSNVPGLYVPSELDTAFSNPLFATRLAEIVEDMNSRLTGDGVPLGGVSYLSDDGIDALPDVPLLKYLSEKYAGKVIYIDLWATWCGPCMAAMESAPELHKCFEGRDVVFVNLCGESNPDEWLPTVERNGIGGENYFLDGDATKIFMGEYNLIGFPSYLIVDRDGMVHRDVPAIQNIYGAMKKLEEFLK
jgi:thiol-disulfide isomerase/thioredoxin